MLKKKKTKAPIVDQCTSTASGGVLKCVLDRDHKGGHATAHIGERPAQKAIWDVEPDGRIHVWTFANGKKQSDWFEGAANTVKPPSAPSPLDEDEDPRPAWLREQTEQRDAAGRDKKPAKLAAHAAAILATDRKEATSESADADADADADSRDEPDSAARWHCEAPFVGGDGREYKCEARNEHHGAHYAWSAVNKETIHAIAATEPDLYSADACSKCGKEMGMHDGKKCPNPAKAAKAEQAKPVDTRPIAARCYCGGKTGKAKPHDLGKPVVCKVPSHDMCMCELGAEQTHMLGAPGCEVQKHRPLTLEDEPDDPEADEAYDAEAAARANLDHEDEPDELEMRTLAREHREAREAHAIDVEAVAEPSTAIARVEEQTGLLSVEHARAFLAKSISVDEVRDVMDKAKAVALYLRSRDASIESQNDAAEIRLRAERRLGELTAEMEKHKGGRPKTGNEERPVSGPPTLADHGIKKHDASKWQQLAKIPEKKFEECVEETRAKGERLTANAPLKMVRQEGKAKKAAELRAKPIPQVTGRFDVIVIDPPWKYEKRAEDITQRGQGDYPRMELDAIKALPVADRAEDSCILFCWVTNAMMRSAYACLDAWGFQEKTILTWGKATFGYGDWLRGQTEHCILAVKGSPIVTLTNQSTLIGGPVREHSRKPDEFYALVESLCPGTRLDMFAQEPREGWVLWGAETNKFAGAA